MRNTFNYIYRAAIPAVLFFLLAVSVYAEDKVEQDLTDKENMLIIDEVKVEAKVKEDAIEGKSVLTEEVIELLPKGNGDITEALRVIPSVQFDDAYKSSKTGGEIEPARISISGGKDYQNLFLIDGMNNSSMLNPSETNVYKKDNIAGHPQKFFVDSSVVEKVTVYDSNIPVKYDGFLGGVVDVETKKPSTEKFWGNISYRTTRSEWTHFYVDEYKKHDFENNTTSQNQPKFEKHHFNTTLNTPVTDSTALLFGYKRLESSIPVKFYNDWNTEKRLSESFMAKGVINFDSSTYIDAALTYSPYARTYYLKNVLNSKYSLNGGGYYGAVNYVRKEKNHDLKIHVDYSESDNTREAHNYFYSWAATSTKDWGFGGSSSVADSGDVYVADNSPEGGYGDIEKTEKELNFKIDQEVGKYKFAGSHSLSYGIHYANIRGTIDKTETSYVYKDPVINRDVICGDSTNDCVEGEQFFSDLKISPAYSADAEINQLKLYGEDLYDFWRMNLRLGLRYTYDDYMANHDISYRTSLNYDIFNNKKTVLIFGYNRYYGSNLLDNKLREGKPQDKSYVRTTYRNEVQAWLPQSSYVISQSKYSDLDTPYSDEYMAGVAQYLFGGTLNLKFIERENRDEFASELVKENGISYRRLNNNGESSFRSVQAKWDRSWKNHNLMMNIMWQESKTAQENYDDNYDLEDLDKQVYYNGELIKLVDLPKNNYNRPITVNLTYTGRFFKKLTISPVVKYRASYRKVVHTNDAVAIGTSDEFNSETGEYEKLYASEYETKKFDPSVLTDVRFAWTQNVWKDHKITLSLDVSNIFNEKIVNGYSSDDGAIYEDYELGRSFWAGVEYEF